MKGPLEKSRCKADHMLRRIGTLAGQRCHRTVLKKRLPRNAVIPQAGKESVDDLPAQAVQDLPGIFPGGGDAPGNGTHIACEAFAVLPFQVLQDGDAVQKILPLPLLRCISASRLHCPSGIKQTQRMKRFSQFVSV